MKKSYMWGGLVVLVLVIAGIVYAVDHKSNGNGYNTNSSTSSNNPYTPASGSSNGTGNSAAVITTKTNSAVGQYLTDANDRTLYTYNNDQPGQSNCTGSCASAWPPYIATSTSSTLPTNVSTIRRSDGGTQYTYKNKPLYYFQGESAGQVTGNGIDGFSVAKP